MRDNNGYVSRGPKSTARYLDCAKVGTELWLVGGAT